MGAAARRAERTRCMPTDLRPETWDFEPFLSRQLIQESFRFQIHSNGLVMAASVLRKWAQTF
jgi:hypothetical protein